MTFSALILLSNAPSALAGECADLFKPGRQTAQAATDIHAVDEYFNSVAKFPTSQAFVASVGVIPSNRSALFARLLAPSIWTYARLKVVDGTKDDPVAKMFAVLKRRPFAEGVITSADRIGRERPRIMTGEERRMAQETGNFLHVEPIPVYRTPQQMAAQERVDFLQRMIRESETAFLKKKTEEGIDASLVQFNQMNADALVSRMTSVQLQRLVAHPVEFAMSYAVTHGLFYKAGPQGAALSKLLPWSTYTYGEQSDLVPLQTEFAGLARSLYKNPADRRVFDNSVLEVLRAEFAPQLQGTLDVGE